MRPSTLRSLVPPLLFTLLTTFVGCGEDTPLTPQAPRTKITEAGRPAPAPASVALSLAELAGWTLDADAVASLDLPAGARRAPELLSAFVREDLGGGIAHYSAQIRIGSGPYEVIGIHRVVKEKKPGKASRTLPNLFLMHGDAKDFNGMFLPGTSGPAIPDDFGLAIYLAQAGVDVWGLDQGWCFIPDGETDMSQGVGWGLQRAADDLRLGVAIARLARLVTGNGAAPMNVLGYSSGVMTVYAAANDEAVLAERERNIGGIVQAEVPYKTDSPSFAQVFCDDIDLEQSLLDAGEYLTRIPFDYIGYFYELDPDGDSPLIPGFTNSQVYWYFLCGGVFGNETFHYFGGYTGEDGFATAFRFVDPDWVSDFLASAVKFQPTQFFWDYDQLICGENDAPWDDNLSMIDVPILVLSAHGGINDLGDYTPTLTASTDVSSILVSTLPAEQVREDFAHIDLFLAPLAQDLAWPGLLDWVMAHVPDPGHAGPFVRDLIH